MANIDRLDSQILKLLTEDARVGVVAISEALGVSRNTVQLRINRLEETGVLCGFQPIINFAAIGMPIQAQIEVELDQRRLKHVIKGLADLPEVVEVRIQAGREDILVHVAIASLEALQELTSSIVAIEGTRKTNSQFFVSTPVPFRIQPMLDSLTRDTGWGRSTPAAEHN